MQPSRSAVHHPPQITLRPPPPLFTLSVTLCPEPIRTWDLGLGRVHHHLALALSSIRILTDFLPVKEQPWARSSAVHQPVRQSSPPLLDRLLSSSCSCCAASKITPTSQYHALGTRQPITTAIAVPKLGSGAEFISLGHRPATCQSTHPAPTPFARAGILARSFAEFSCTPSQQFHHSLHRARLSSPAWPLPPSSSPLCGPVAVALDLFQASRVTH